jgi:hypothetical protein
MMKRAREDVGGIKLNVMDKITTCYMNSCSGQSWIINNFLFLLLGPSKSILRD